MTCASLNNTNLFELLQRVTKWKINCLGECQNAGGTEETAGRDDTHLLLNIRRRETCIGGECI
jgi:hypothetical protein